MKFTKAGALAALTVAVIAVGAGPAAADDGPGSDRSPGGLLTDIGNSTADDSSNACRSFLQALTPMRCSVPRDDHRPASRPGASGGVITDDANMQASRNSNACGSSVAVLAPTECVVRTK
ncbi:hypothetical protein ACQEVS_03030 [Streptomyces sp. CA-181903]|uniref:hypothetical protein n=1 Tax=Streptomyces sp. CA-181903 TaxID=3240055 RepID=UPI003D89BA0F